MWTELVSSILSIIDKLLGLRVAKAQDPDIQKAAKAGTEVVIEDEGNKTVSNAVKTGDLAELQKEASE